jgi:hypothetical protein
LPRSLVVETGQGIAANKQHTWFVVSHWQKSPVPATPSGTGVAPVASQERLPANHRNGAIARKMLVEMS